MYDFKYFSSGQLRFSAPRYVKSAVADDQLIGLDRDKTRIGCIAIAWQGKHRRHAVRIQPEDPRIAHGRVLGDPRHGGIAPPGRLEGYRIA